VKENQLADVKTLLASGSNLVNMADDNGITALIWAASKGHGEMVGVLLEFGADKTAVTKKGNDALQAAKKCKEKAPGDARSDHAIRILEAPPGLKLEGGSLPGNAAKYGGTYKLDPRKLVNGRPAYQHTSDATRWIAFAGNGWMGQIESQLGKWEGHLALTDSAAASPDVSAKTWKVSGGAGSAWVEAPQLKCTAWTPPPPPLAAEPVGAMAGSSAGFYTCAEAKTAGFTLTELRTSGYTCADAKAAGFVEGLKAAGFTCLEVKTVGYTLAEMRVGGFTCAEVKAAGYVMGLKEAGYTCLEVKAAGGGFTCADAKAAGFIEGLKAAGFSCLEAKTVGYTLAEMRVGGFTCAEVKAAGCAMGLKEAGYTCLEAKAAGYMLAEMRVGGYDSTEVKAAGYTLAEMRVGGYTEGLKALGYTCAEAKAAGYVMGLKAAGYTCAEAKAGNYTCAQVKMAGYTLAEMRSAGFTCAEAKAAGFNPKESMQAGFTYQEGLAVGYPSHIDGHPTNVTSWNFGMQPPRLESTISLPALPPPPRARPSVQRPMRRAAALRAARALRAACWRSDPCCRLTTARVRAWRRGL
jgi:ribosomal protein L13E